MTTTGYVGHTEARVKIILGSVHLPLSFIHSGPKGWRRAPHTSAFRQREALTWLFSFGSLLLGDCVLEERSYDGIWRRRGAKGGSFKPAGHLPFTTAFWLAARKSSPSPALHCIHGAEKKLVLPKTRRQPIRKRMVRWRGGWGHWNSSPDLRACVWIYE